MAVSNPRSIFAPPEVSSALLASFGFYMERYLRRHFHGVRLSKSSTVSVALTGEPLVVYLNHPSWWDPLIAALLARRLLPDRRHYAPIDARALGRYSFFGRLGFFGVEQGSRRGARRFLQVSASILAHEGTTLWVTPQGRFADPRVRPLELAPGTAHLARRMERGSILPLALEYPFWHERLPEALACFGEPLSVEALRGCSTDEVQRQLTLRLEDTADALERQSAARDEDAFVCLLGGPEGVGGVYDLWRSLLARLRRRDFDASHSAVMREREEETKGGAAA